MQHTTETYHESGNTNPGLTANHMTLSDVILIPHIVKDLSDAGPLGLGLVPVAALGERVVALNEGSAEGFVRVVQRLPPPL